MFFLDTKKMEQYNSQVSSSCHEPNSIFDSFKDAMGCAFVKACLTQGAISKLCKQTSHSL